MKKILGLDIGVASIGWAYILESENENEQSTIGDMGVRIIPLDTANKTAFEKGQAITLNQSRTEKRGARRNLDRYQLRRKSLSNALRKLNMLPGEELIHLTTIELYGLRNKALKQPLSLKEIGRILLHLNQKRGYKSSRKEDAKISKDDADKKNKESEYLTGINERSKELIDKKITIGQKLYADFLKNFEENNHEIITLSIKNKIYPRADYIAEFNAIWDFQAIHHPSILTEENKINFRDNIIYHQRPLKSQKNLIRICELEGKKRPMITHDGKTKEKYTGPRVAARSNPIAQICKIWESINTLKLENLDAKKMRVLSLNEKEKIFSFLNSTDKMTLNDLRKLLGDKNIRSNQQMEKAGLKGNDTLVKICRALKAGGLSQGVIDSLTSFNLKLEPKILSENLITTINNYQSKSTHKLFEATTEVIDKNSGEIITLSAVSKEIEQEPLYILWHMLHSIDDKKELKIALLKNKKLIDLGLNVNAIDELCAVNFKNDNYTNKSVKAMRKILPYLQMGYMYSEACTLAGYIHSDSLSKEENSKRILSNKLCHLKKGELRQPIVEKILNQLINLVNAILIEPSLGRPDEIRIELARELQQSVEQRSDTFNYNLKRNTENDEIAKEIERYGLKATAHRKKKWRVWHETKGYSLYTGKTIGLSEFLNADAADIEHIIPQSVFFDNSMSNWTIVEREENIKKGATTAYDWMAAKGEAALQEYVKQVNYYYSQFISKDNKEKAIYRVGFSKRKRDYLLMTADSIPKDFINRQLNETRYISRKAGEILSQICHSIKYTSGSITDYLRHHWGYDNILHDLNFERYKNAGLTYINEDKKERIKDWSKRMDHRHHAVDALVVACTKQSIIQRLNNLNQKKEKTQNIKDVDNKGLKKLVQEYKIFDKLEVQNKTESILVSFKPGKRVVSKRKNKIGNQIRLEPRGSLHEDSIYGVIKRIAQETVKLNTKFKLEYLDNIICKSHKQLVIERLLAFGNDPKKAFDKLSKNPIWIDKEQKKSLTEVKVYEETTVIKYKLNDSFKEKDTDFIVDKSVREIVKKRFQEKGNQAMKNLENFPILFNGKAIKSVRCYAEITAYETLKQEKENNAKMAVVKPGNNHHVTICADENGKQYELETVTFWEAVVRAKQGLSIFGKPKEEGHRVVCTLQQNEIFYFENEKLNHPQYYRVQKFATGQYIFRNINETSVDKSNPFYKQLSASSFNLKKVVVTILGKIKNA